MIGAAGQRKKFMNYIKAKYYIERIGIEFQIQEPFYGSIFRRLKKIFMMDVGTIGLRFSGHGLELCINPDYINKLKYPEIRAVCLHILFHVVFKHMIKINKSEDLERGPYNIAAELEVNQRINNLPKNALKFEDVFSEEAEEIERKQDAEYYYSRLFKNENIVSMKTLDNHDYWDLDSLLQDLLEEGDAAPTDEPMEQEESMSHEQEGEGEERYDPFELDKSKELDMEGDTSLSDQDVSIEDLLRKAEEEAEGELPGNLPADLFRKIYIEEEDAQVKQDWYKILREFLNKLLYKSSFTHYELKRSLRRPNKKLGFPFPSIKVDPLPRLNIAVCVDGSGSVDNRTFQEFMQEVNCLYDREIDITMIGFDFEVKEVNVIKNYNPSQWIKAKKLVDLFPGELGGGTDYVPPVELACELRPKPDCVVMFTDSYDDGNLEQPNIPIIFILSQKREDFYDWAICVNMFDHEEETIYLFSSKPTVESKDDA